ncbi:MAG: amino acid ABC transporter permease [Clostridium sp.]|jgi:L-cystine transport system permease protein|nr:amino acid ABC transporter permease [Clostridium sp.]
MATDLFKPELIPELVVKIGKSFPVTFLLAVCSLALGLTFAFGVAAAGLCRCKPLNVLSRGYVHFIRGIPSLILIYLLYLGFPQLMKNAFGIDMSRVPKSVYLVWIFAIAVSANFAELMRSAYAAVAKGQREAALACGMTGAQAFRRVVFPQAFGVALPSLGNLVIMLFKLTSLGFIVGVVDLMGKAKILSARTYGSRRLEVYLALAMIYWVLCFGLERLNAALVKRYTRGRREMGGAGI